MDIVILCHISYCQNKRIIWKVNWKLDSSICYISFVVGVKVQNPKKINSVIVCI